MAPESGEKPNYIWHSMPDEVRNRQPGDKPAPKKQQPKEEPVEEEQPEECPVEEEQPEECPVEEEQPEECPVEEEQPQEIKAPEEQPQDMTNIAEVAPPTTTGTKRRSKTKHTVNFRGPKWSSVLKSKRKELEQAFKADVKAGTGLQESRMENVELTFKDVLTATFIVRNTDEKDETQELNAKLHAWKFPATTALYPKK